MFAPPKLLSNLCRETATVRHGGKEHLGESVDQYAFCISSLFTRLLAVSKPTASSTQKSEMFAWECLKLAVFENELLPSIRHEQERRDPVRTFAAARDGSRNHVSNIWDGANSINLSSVVSTPAPILKHQVETRLEVVQGTFVSLVEVSKYHRRGRSKPERRTIHGCLKNSVPQSNMNNSKGNSTRAT